MAEIPDFVVSAEFTEAVREALGIQTPAFVGTWVTEPGPPIGSLFAKAPVGIKPPPLI